MIVIDASAFLELLLRTPTGLAVEELLAGDAAAAPHFFDAEVFHRLVTFGKHGVLAAHEVVSAVADTAGAPIHRVDHRRLFPQAQTFSAALSGYDALYAALAAQLDATLVTGDLALARTARAQFHLAVADLPSE